MNGSEVMVRTLLSSSVSVCFANPGTSEMHFVAALDKLPEMRCILGLFENVATGAADGYYRIARKPAATLLHLGPGLSNGLANLHNAKRAGSGIVNIIGQHALDHIANDAPLTSDIEAIARPVSQWIRTTVHADTAAVDTAAAVTAANAHPGQVASLILPADAAWTETNNSEIKATQARPAAFAAESIIENIAQLISSGKYKPESIGLLLGGRALLDEAPNFAGQIAAKTGCRLLAEPKNARSMRGRGRVNIPQIPTPVDGAIDYLQDIKLLILVDAIKPVAFFAYPEKSRFLVSDDCRVETLATKYEDSTLALAQLAERLGVNKNNRAYVGDEEPTQWEPGRPDSLNLGRALAMLMPENSIVIDEAITSGRQLQQAAHTAAPHDWMEITGGALGYGMPAAIGAALARPDARVVAIIGDGTAMFSLQALWTMAREGLDITVIICANHRYSILDGELHRMGGPKPGRNAERMLSIVDPTLDWVAMAKGHGVPGTRVDNMESFADALERSFRSAGPSLIEVLL